MTSEEKITYENTAIDSLILSKAALHLCYANRLYTLMQLIEFYQNNGSFKILNDCGSNINKELVNSIKLRWREDSSFVKGVSQEISENIVYVNGNLQEFDISLAELKEIEMFSERTINVCINNELNSLSKILEYYIKNKTFTHLRNCGIKTDKELVRVCNKYRFNQVSEVKVIDKFVDIWNQINNFSPIQKGILKKHYHHLLQSLNLRSCNGLKRISVSLDMRTILERIYKNEFDFYQIKNIGDKSVGELEAFRDKLKSFIEFLNESNQQQLDKEYSKYIVRNLFCTVNSSANFEDKFELFLDVTNKIKLFSLIKTLVNHGSIYSVIERKIFYLIYSNDIIEAGSIHKEFNITKERVRQIKVKMQSNTHTEFQFVSNFHREDLVNYGIDEGVDLHVIDYEFSERINDKEDVKFNTLFYSTIFGVYLAKTHAVLGDDEVIYGKRKTSNRKNYEKRYLIIRTIFDCFDFEKCINDVYILTTEKVVESYSLHFKGFLFQYLRQASTLNLDRIGEICEVIIFNEFDLVVDVNGYLTFECSGKLQLINYVSVALETIGEMTKIDDITEFIQNKYPALDVNTQNVRSVLQRNKEIFIFIGRKSTYGLRKWEEERCLLRGGTIRELTIEYLGKFDEPKQIRDISSYIEKYRPDTYHRSIWDNLKADKSGNFIFFGNGLVGLKSVVYEQQYVVPSKKTLKDWNDKYMLLVHYRLNNPNKWPSITSAEQNERFLYRFTYENKKLWKRNELDHEKKRLLQDINFPFDSFVPRKKK